MPMVLDGPTFFTKAYCGVSKLKKRTYKNWCAALEHYTQPLSPTLVGLYHVGLWASS